MSTVAAASSWQPSLATTTVRQFRWVLLWTLSLAALGALTYGLETAVLRLDRRFAENPVEAVMRAFALAHFVIGWLFLFTSRRIRNKQAGLRVGLATLAGIALCLLFAWFGALDNPLLALFFYAYFLVHEVRDEAVIYQAYGDAPEMSPAAAAALRSLSRSTCLSLMSVLAAMYLLHVVISGKSGLTHVSQTLVTVLGLVLVAACAWSWRQTWRLGVNAHGDGRLFLQAHAPLLWVYAGLGLVLMVGSLLGSTGLNLVIIIHVAAWLVFIRHQLAARPLACTWNLWTWLRSTPAGFLTLHVGLTLFFLVLFAMRVYVWQRIGFVSQLLASDSFCYWSLMHISMAFWSSR
jgi:Ca2+/Na+ antiporter